MYLTIINGYELGQFLRIFLWICVPIAMCALLITTWLQYRRRQKFSEGLFLSMAGEEEAMASTYHGSMDRRNGDDQGGGETGGAQAEMGRVEVGGDHLNGTEIGFDDESRDDRVEETARRVADTFGEEDYKENLYKGILWMKDKYEQYRDMADQRYERLKDQLTKVERRYEELLTSFGGPHPAAGAKPGEPTAQPEIGPTEPMPPANPMSLSNPVSLSEPMSPSEPISLAEPMSPSEPISLAQPIGMESIVSVESGPLGETALPGEARALTEALSMAGPTVEAKGGKPEQKPEAFEQRVWIPEARVEMADLPVAEREERTHAQELEEQLARTRQRLEEELGRVRYQLEEEIARSRRQQDEQAAVSEANRHLEQQMAYSNRQLEEKQRIIADLEGQLRSDRQKIEELVTKLRNNSQLLMKIYQELDKSIHLSDFPKEG